jgi:predicted RNase H-like nuclease (RuvC/YqgF family)
VTELLTAAASSPLLLAFLVVLGGLVWAVERLSGANGPLTRAIRAWQERELRRLRRERALREEQRAARQEESDARVVELEREIEWLREQLDRARSGRPELHPATEPIPSRHRRNSARPPVPPR